MLAAIILLLPAPAQSAVKVPPFWAALAQCETSSRWDWGAFHRPGEGHLYEGGLGFATSTWRLWAGAVGVLRRYPHAYVAPPLVQVKVGRYGLAQHGYWGCLAQHAWIWALPGR